tara:strand:+ start:1832 stop:2059 length:228 start_codon:yes stop_codon:yes gene_type:complete
MSKIYLSIHLPYWQDDYDSAEIKRGVKFAVSTGGCGCCAEPVELTRDEAYDYCQRVIAAAQKCQAEILKQPSPSH